MNQVYPKIQIIIDYLLQMDNTSANPKRFNNNGVENTLTIGCIAKILLNNPKGVGSSRAIKQLCEVPFSIAKMIAQPPSVDVAALCGYNCSLAQAIDLLKICRDTGEVKWLEVMAKNYLQPIIQTQVEKLNQDTGQWEFYCEEKAVLDHVAFPDLSKISEPGQYRLIRYYQEILEEIVK